MLLFYPLCYAAVLLKFTYYSEEQEMWSDLLYYAIYIQVCMNELLLVVDNFRKTVLLESIYEWYPSIPLMSIR